MKIHFITSKLILVLSLVFSSYASYGDDEFLKELKEKYSVSGTSYSLDWYHGSDEHINFLRENIKNKEKLLELMNQATGLESSVETKALIALVGSFILLAEVSYHGYLKYSKAGNRKTQKKLLGMELEKLRSFIKNRNMAAPAFLLLGLIWFRFDIDGEHNKFQTAVVFSKEQHKEYIKLNLDNAKTLGLEGVKLDGSIVDFFRNRETYNALKEALKVSLAYDKYQLQEFEL